MGAGDDEDGCLVLLRDALEALPEVIVVFDRDDRFVFWNRAFMDVYGEGGDVRPGVRFEDHLRACLADGRVPAAVGRKERWLTKPHRDRLEHDLWLMRHHVHDIGEVMTDALQAAPGPDGL